MYEKIIFVLEGKLPRYYNAAIAIFTIAQKPKLDKFCIQAYVTALIDIWTKSVGVEHILTRGFGTKQVEKLVTKYYNNVYSKSHCKHPKKKRSTFIKKPIR